MQDGGCETPTLRATFEADAIGPRVEHLFRGVDAAGFLLCSARLGQGLGRGTAASLSVFGLSRLPD
jgi:hypothetical protein